MRLTTRISAFFAVLLLALTFSSGASAQDMQDPFNTEDLEGIQNAVLRTYTIDFTSMMDSASTPGAEVPEMTGVFALTGGIFQFDSGDNAGNAFGTVDGAATEGAGATGAELEEVDVDLGDQSKGYKTEEEVEGQTLSTVFAVVQQDEFIYLTAAVVADGDAEQLAKDFTQVLLDNDASDDAAQFNEDGTSTGGLWNKFPAADDDLVAGLTPIDQQLYPATESAPATDSTPVTAPAPATPES